MGLNRLIVSNVDFVGAMLAHLTQQWQADEPNWIEAESIANYVRSETEGTWVAGIARDLDDAVRRRDPVGVGTQLLAVRVGLEIVSAPNISHRCD